MAFNGNITINLPDLTPKESFLPSGRQVLITGITLAYCQEIFKFSSTAKDDGISFTRMAVETMLRENPESDFLSFTTDDQTALIHLAVEAWGCEKEFEQLKDVEPVERRFYAAAKLQLRNYKDSILQSFQATQDSMARALSRISLSHSYQMEALSTSITKLARSLVVPLPDLSRLTTDVSKMLQTYPIALESLYSPEYLNAFSPSLPKLAQVEMHNALVIENHIQGIEIDETIIDAEGLDELETLLTDLDPALVAIYRGAVDAAYSDNSDKVRHFTTSHRELDRLVLHMLAPNDEVKNWTQDPHHFAGKNPTRRARLLFIVRNAPEAAREAMEFFVRDGMTQYDLLNGDQHRLSHEYSDHFIIMLHERYSSWLQAILMIASGKAFRH